MIKKRFLCALLLFLPALASAQSRAPVPQWYAEVKAGWVGVDAEAADDAALAGVVLGRNLNARWGVELEAFTENADFNAGFEREQEGIQLNLIQVNRVPLWNPYFQLGLGALHYQIPGESDTDVSVSVSIGGMWELSRGGIMLRADARYRYSLLDSETPGVAGSGEPQFTLGLVFPLFP